jgi:DNA-binding transcriptional LysR family regulator
MIGKHVRFLEERIGAQLLNRTTRRQSLTEVGRAFYERCKLVLAEAEAAEALAQDLQAIPRGRLRVNAPVTFGSYSLVPMLTRYMRRYTEVTVDLTLSDRIVDLVDEGYDAVIRISPLTDSTLITRSLAPYRLVACASPAYLADRGVPARPEDLATHECLGFAYWRDRRSMNGNSPTGSGFIRSTCAVASSSTAGRHCARRRSTASVLFSRQPIC